MVPPKEIRQCSASFSRYGSSDPSGDLELCSEFIDLFIKMAPLPSLRKALAPVQNIKLNISAGQNR
ncbi:MAG: hypothetical protein WA822_07225, partial [Albidovulum sp.]